MFISRSLKQLLSLINDKNYEQAEAKLVEISNSIVITNFIPSDPKFKSDLLPTILQSVLPITYNEQLSLRLQAESFLIHWYSLLSSFSPVYLLDVYQNLQTTTLQPAAQASLLTFLTNALHYISPKKRADYLGTCHSLLLSSQPGFLNHLTQSDWELLANTFSKQIIPSIVTFLLNSPLTYAVVTFLQKDPDTIIPIIANDGKLQFLKQIIPLIPQQIPISIKLLQSRLFEFIHSQNSQFISGAIEIIILLINRPRLKDDRDNWREVFSELSDFWETTTNLSQKSALIDLFTSAAKNNMIPINSLHRFMVYDKSTPTVIAVSIIKSSAIFVKNQKKIPKGLIQFLKEKAIDREPLEFLAIIEFLIECFNELYSIAPNSAEQLLDLCINPLSQYFVEQNAILRLLKIIDYNVFPMSKLRTDIVDIILYFISNPHPSVINEVKSLIDTLKISLPYTKLDWFEKAHLYLRLLSYCDPNFIMELLDFNLLTAATYPDAIISIADEITDKDSKLANLLFFRCLYVVLESLKVLKIDFNAISSIEKSVTQEWSQLCTQLPEMHSMINESLSNTSFGRVIDSSLYLLATTVKYVDLSVNRGIDMIEIATIFGTSFAVNSCKLVRQISKKFIDFKIAQEVSDFFAKIFPFNESVNISRIAIGSLHKYEIDIILNYLCVASNVDRNLLKYVKFTENDLYKTFLAFKNDPSKQDYIIKCMKAIPFVDWQIEADDLDYFVNTKFDFQIHIHDLVTLDEMHKKVYDLVPSLFIVDFDIVFDNENIIDDISEKVFLGTSISEEYENDIQFDNSSDLIEFEPELISPYKYFKPSKPLLLAFLWFSNRKNGLDQDSFEKVQKYALSQLNKDSRFVLSFLSYSNRHKYQINIEEWTGRFKMNRNDRNTILSFALLTSWIRKPWSDLTPNELKCITSSMNDIGVYSFNEYNLYHLYKERSGDIKMIVHCVISIDPSRFNEFPFFSDLFTYDIEDFFSNKFDLLLEKVKEDASLLYEVISLFTRYLLPVPTVSVQLYFDIPPFLFSMLNFYNSNIKIDKVQQLKPPNNQITEKLISFFENNRQLDSFLCQLIEKFSLTSSQYKRMIMPLRNFPQSHPSKIHFALRSMAVVDNSSSNSLFIDFMTPPSITRHFVSILLSPHAPKLQSKDINLMIQKLRPIIFDFLYVGFDKISDKLYDHQFHPPLTSGILLENLTSKQVTILKQYITKISLSSTVILKNFLEMNDDRLCSYFKGRNRQSVVLDITNKIIEMLTNTNCMIMYTVIFFKVVFWHDPLFELYMSIFRESVLNAPESLNLFLLINMFDIHLKTFENSQNRLSQEDKNAIATFNATKKELPDKIQNPERAKILLCDDALATFAKLLNSNCD